MPEERARVGGLRVSKREEICVGDDDPKPGTPTEVI